MEEKLNKVKSPIIVILIPIIGSILISNLIQGNQIIKLIAILCLGYPIYWLYSSIKIFESKENNLNSISIIAIFTSYIIFFIISVLIGSYLTKSYSKQIILYSPIIITSLIHLIFLIKEVYKLSKIFKEKNNINQYLSTFLLLTPITIPFYQGYIQSKINKIITNEEDSSSNSQVENYIKQYKQTYSKESIIESLKTNFNLSEKEAKKEYEKTN